MAEEPHKSKPDQPHESQEPPRPVPHSVAAPQPIFPNASDANFRVACNEIAEQLSKNWRFKRDVGGLVVTALVVLAAAIGGIVGWSISASLASERQRFQEQARHDIESAKQAVEAEIAEEFKKENVQRTLDAAVARAAPALFAKSVEPSIKAFQRKLDTSEANLEKRLKDFNETIRKNEETSTANVEALHIELERLQKRNNLTTLADKAISEGDIEVYRQLEDLMKTSQGTEMSAATLAESFRVFQAYSLFSGVSRTGDIHLNVGEINPSKTKEEELEVNDLLPFLKVENRPLVRVKLAELIFKKGAKHGSYKTAEAIAQAIERETHLEAHKVLATVFRATTGYQGSGRLDNRELLQWWEENKDRLKKEDTDATPTPTPTPSVTATKH